MRSKPKAPAVGRIQLWSVEGKLLRSFEGHQDMVVRVAFSPDGRRLLSADRISDVRLWDIETREKLDKDRFRRDLGGLVEAYQEVARRLGIMNENEPVRGTGPVLVK